MNPDAGHFSRDAQKDQSVDKNLKKRHKLKAWEKKVKAHNVLVNKSKSVKNISLVSLAKDNSDTPYLVV